MNNYNYDLGKPQHVITESYGEYETAGIIFNEGKILKDQKHKGGIENGKIQKRKIHK